MPIDLTSEAMAQLTALLTQIFLSPKKAEELAQDTNGELEAAGLTGQDFSGGIDVTQAALLACQAPGVPAPVQSAVQNYAATPHPPAYSVQEVAQQVQQVTYVTYEDNSTIVEQLVQNNNNINVGDNAQDVDIDVDNLTQGDNSVGNTGNNSEVAGATGDRANATTGDGNTQNSGDGGVAVGGQATVGGPIVTGGVSGGVVGNNNSLNDSVVGDGNQVANVDGGGAPVFIPFGSGNTAVQGSTVQDANVGVGGNAQNISNNDASYGGAIGGRDATAGYQEDNSTHSTVETHSTVDDHSTFAEQGALAQGGENNTNEDNDTDDFVAP